MPRPATVTTLLQLVEEQTQTIRQQAQAIEALTHAMRQKSAAPVQTAPVRTGHQGLPQVVSDAIRSASFGDAGLREHLEEWAWEAMAGEMAPELVAQQIAQGVQD
jgi:hypothetical protein